MRIVFAKSTMSIGGAHGAIYDLEGGRAYSADHPAVVARPELFSDTPTFAMTARGFEVVEQATSAPGEKRAEVKPGSVVAWGTRPAAKEDLLSALSTEDLIAEIERRRGK